MHHEDDGNKNQKMRAREEGDTVNTSPAELTTSHTHSRPFISGIVEAKGNIETPFSILDTHPI